MKYYWQDRYGHQGTIRADSAESALIHLKRKVPGLTMVMDNQLVVLFEYRTGLGVNQTKGRPA